ncbi:hypothetical protein [Streptomyces brevispora]|uniref:hypothetical protein n=1 Tax=Streptomyces brevispora TaxID=887462 RepID=UPI002E3476F1|nr:hypothetical protein [Streptomyces brevispora]
MRYASEALRALLRFARERGITCAHGDVGLENVVSQRVMAASGMRLVREDSLLQHSRVGRDGPAGQE